MDQYQKIGILGKGSKGTIFLCKKIASPEEYVVIKAISKEKERIKNIGYLKDYVIPKIVSYQENIGSVYEAFEDDQNFYVVGKYYKDARDLLDFDLDPQLYLTTIIEFATIIARAIKELHVHAIIHRDIKPENILFMQIEEPSSSVLNPSSSVLNPRELEPSSSTPANLGETLYPPEELKFYQYIPIIIDFDLSCIDKEDSKFPCTGFVGTPKYAPPEYFRGTYSDPMKGDIYSLGIVFYFLFSDGGYPYSYDDQDIQRLAEQTIFDEPRRLKTPSPVLNLLVHKMLTKNYHLRPRIEEVLRELQIALTEVRERAAGL